MQAMKIPIFSPLQTLIFETFVKYNQPKHKLILGVTYSINSNMINELGRPTIVDLVFCSYYSCLQWRQIKDTTP